MKVIILVGKKPPKKSDWVHSDAKRREPWGEIFSLITNTFCTSHGFRHENHVTILIPEGESTVSIDLDGQRLRYLAPSLRSAASLVLKAYQHAFKKSSKIESTPGISAILLSSPDAIIQSSKPVLLYYNATSDLPPPQDTILVNFLSDDTTLVKDLSTITTPIPYKESLLWMLHQ